MPKPEATGTRGAKPRARQHDIQFSTSSIACSALRDAARLVATVSSLAFPATDRAGSAAVLWRGFFLLPKTLLEIAAASSMQLVDIAELGSTNAVALLQLLWVPTPSRVALLQLHALSLRVIADSEVMTTLDASEQERYLNLQSSIGYLLCRLFERTPTRNVDLQDAALATASLAVRMDVLPATSKLLAAVRTSDATNNTWGWHLIGIFPGALLPVLHDLFDRDKAEEDQRRLRLQERQRPPKPQTRQPGRQAAAPLTLAAELLDAVSRSLVVEHWACTLHASLVAKARGAIASAAAPAAGPAAASAPAGGNGSGGARAAIKPEAPVLQDSGNSFSEGTAVLEFLADLGSWLLAGKEPFGGDGQAASPQAQRESSGGLIDDGTDQRHRDLRRFTASLRAIQSGPCLQYVMTARVVTQLAAADGGTLYGLAEAQMIPAVAMVPNDSAGSDGGGPSAGPQPAQLAHTGLTAVLESWIWCLGQSPPVPLVLHSHRVVYELSLRLVRLAVRSAEAHQARRREGQQLGPGDHRTAGNPGQQPQQPAAPGTLQTLARRRQQLQQPPHETLPQFRLQALEQRQEQVEQAEQQVKGQLQQLRQQQGPPEMRLLLPDEKCTEVALLGLRCGALASLQLPAGTAGGITAADTITTRWWCAATPALHMVVSQGEARVSDSGAWPAYAMETTTMAIGLDCWPAGDLPPSPPVNLAAALAAGYVPLLERALRVHQRARKDSTSSLYLFQVFCHWPRLGRLLAYGTPHESAALVVTGAKLVRRVLQLAVESKGIGGTVDLEKSYEKISKGLDSILQWLRSYAAVLKIDDNARAGDAATVTETHDGTVVVRHGAAEALGIQTKCSCGDCCRTSGRFSSCGAAPHGGSTAGGGGGSTAGADGGSPLLQWAPGPSRQLLRHTFHALQQWLPTLARIAMTDELPASTIKLQLQAGHTVMVCVRALVLALAMAEGRLPLPDWRLLAEGGCPVMDEASRRRAAASLRQLLLQGLDFLALLGRMLRLLAVFGKGPGLIPRRQAQLLLCMTFKTLECVSGVLPGEVAAALRDGTLPPFTPESLYPPGDKPLASDIRQRTRMMASLRRIQAADPAEAAAWYQPPVASELPVGEVGCATLLLWASASAAGGADGVARPLPRSCSNLACTNLAGDSEADLALRTCSGCGQAWYCGAECQLAHWRAGHKGACVRRGGG